MGSEIERELALHHLRAAFGMYGNLERRQLGMVRSGGELALQFEGRKMRVDVGHLVTRLERRVRRLLPWRLRSGVGAVGQACCNAHDDGTVIARLRTEIGHVALK